MPPRPAPTQPTMTTVVTPLGKKRGRPKTVIKTDIRIIPGPVLVSFD